MPVALQDLQSKFLQLKEEVEKNQEVADRSSLAATREPTLDSSELEEALEYIRQKKEGLLPGRARHRGVSWYRELGSLEISKIESQINQLLLVARIILLLLEGPWLGFTYWRNTCFYYISLIDCLVKGGL